MRINNSDFRKNRFELQKLELEKSLILRNYEIDNFWKRGWFFGALLLAVLTGYFALKKDHPSYCVIVSFLGLLISFFQTLMNRGSKYWQERWESKTKHQESILQVDITKTKKIDQTERYFLDAGILAKNENMFTVARRFSVSKLTILVWDTITFFWLFLWAHDCNFRLGSPIALYNSVRWNVFWFHFCIISYILLFFFAKRPSGKEDVLRKRWYDFIKKGGGKVYEGMVGKPETLKGLPKNVRKPYFEHSEAYVKNETTNLDDIAKSTQTN